MGEAQPAGWAYHLPDALGSVRQLTDSDPEVTLARSYEPFGSVMASSGSGETSYSFTGEWADGTGLMHLRARYYAPRIGRFNTRDLWKGDIYQPISFNAWLYAISNPVNVLDSSGLYHYKVHYDLTYNLVKNSWIIRIAAPLEDPSKIAQHIASADWNVDDHTSLNSAFCNDCHFNNLQNTYRHVEEAIDTGNLYKFGSSLHQLQDWYAHRNEGYENSHAKHTIFRRTRTIFEIQDFFWGWDLLLNKSPFEAHPREEVIRYLQQNNPGLNTASLSDNQMIDLYLRKYFMDDIETKMEMRDYFGIDPDMYIPDSQRDRSMSSDTSGWILLFFTSIIGDCGLDWSIPEDSTIKNLLTN